MDRRTLAGVLAASALTIGATAPAVAAPPTPESFVVVLEPGTGDVPAVAAELARGAGGRVGHVYQHSIQGFSMTASPAAAAALARNPRVAYVEADMEVSIAAQATPTGISRSFAAGNAAIDIDGTDDSRVDVDVAVIDTGVDWEHPDLDVVDGINCAAGNIFRTTCTGNGDDDHYHGTHVAGTVAAIDNGVGVVGVAPGARIHAVKVLNSQGSGYTSWIIAGIDWVAARSSTIEVANMKSKIADPTEAQRVLMPTYIATPTLPRVAATSTNGVVKTSGRHRSLRSNPIVATRDTVHVICATRTTVSAASASIRWPCSRLRLW